jgi:hypothetical protein
LHPWRSSGYPLYLRLASGRGETGRRNGLKPKLSARRETGGAELLKVGETGDRQSRAKPSNRKEGVETRRAAPTALTRQGEGIVQATNARLGGGESRSGMKIRRAERPVPVQVRPPAPRSFHICLINCVNRIQRHCRGAGRRVHFRNLCGWFPLLWP